MSISEKDKSIISRLIAISYRWILASALSVTIVLMIAYYILSYYLLPYYKCNDGDRSPNYFACSSIDLGMAVASNLIPVSLTFFLSSWLLREFQEIKVRQEWKDNIDALKRDLSAYIDTKFETTASQIDTISRTIRDISHIQILGNYKTMYNLLESHSRELKSNLRAMVSADSEEKSPDTLTEIVSRRLSELREQGQNPRFEVVVVVKVGEISEGFEDWMNKRIDAYKHVDVIDRVDVYILEAKNPAGMDLYIIDENHAFIGFPKYANDKRVSSGIYISNQQDIIRSLITWFESFVRKPAQPYDLWKNKEEDSL